MSKPEHRRSADCRSLRRLIRKNVLGGEIAVWRDRLAISEGFDIGLEMSGAPQAFERMVEHLPPGGSIATPGVADVSVTRIIGV